MVEMKIREQFGKKEQLLKNRYVRMFYWIQHKEPIETLVKIAAQWKEPE